MGLGTETLYLLEIVGFLTADEGGLIVLCLWVAAVGFKCSSMCRELSKFGIII